MQSGYLWRLIGVYCIFIRTYDPNAAVLEHWIELTKGVFRPSGPGGAAPLFPAINRLFQLGIERCGHNIKNINSLIKLELFTCRSVLTIYD